MVRLMLTLTPVVCILSAIALSTIMERYLEKPPPVEVRLGIGGLLTCNTLGVWVHHEQLLTEICVFLYDLNADIRFYLLSKKYWNKLCHINKNTAINRNIYFIICQRPQVFIEATEVTKLYIILFTNLNSYPYFINTSYHIIPAIINKSYNRVQLTKNISVYAKEFGR